MPVPVRILPRIPVDECYGLMNYAWARALRSHSNRAGDNKRRSGLFARELEDAELGERRKTQPLACIRRPLAPWGTWAMLRNQTGGADMQDTQTLYCTDGQSFAGGLGHAQNGSRLVFCKTTCQPVGVSAVKRNEFSGVVTNTPWGSGSDGLRTSTPPPIATPPSLQETCCSTELLGPTVVGVYGATAVLQTT
jgi:hypothetical protein